MLTALVVVRGHLYMDSLHRTTGLKIKSTFLLLSEAASFITMYVPPETMGA